MAPILLGKGYYKRGYDKIPTVNLTNRFYETDPTNRVAPVALLSRPGSKQLSRSGAVGPPRANFTQEGSFGGALFSVSGPGLQRQNRDATIIPILGSVGGAGNVSMAATETTLWVADGASLQFYQDAGSRAQGTLTVTGNAGNTNTVTINGVVYTFNTVLGGAFSVLIGATVAESLQNLADAINAEPTQIGITYGLTTTANPFVYANQPSATVLVVLAKVGGVAGNAYTLAETLVNGAWGGATMAGGAANTLSGVQTPDDVGIVSVAVLGSFTFCLASDSEIIYWIEPGQVVIDPANRIAAEATPDQGISLRVVGDQLWCFGAASTQPFALTGDEDVVAPIRGRAFSKGVLEGTDALTNDDGEVCLVGDDGVVYSVKGGPQRISNFAIEELIRTARAIEREAP